MYPTVTSSCSITGRVKQKDVVWFRFLLFLCPALVVFTRYQSAVTAVDIASQLISIQKGRLCYSLIVFLCIPSFTKFPFWCSSQVFRNQISLNGGHSRKKYTPHAPIDQIMNLILSFTSSHSKQCVLHWTGVRPASLQGDWRCPWMQLWDRWCSAVYTQG